MAIPRFRCYLTLAPSDCPQGIPRLLVTDTSIWGTSLLGLAFRHVICGFYLFFLPVMLPSEIRKLPPDPLVRGFPRVWKLLLFQDSLPWMNLSSLSLFSLSLSFIFCPFEGQCLLLPPFKDGGLLFWVPDVLCQNSEVVLWSLLIVHMFF